MGALRKRRRLTLWLMAAGAAAVAFAGLWVFVIEPASLDVQHDDIRIDRLQTGRSLRVAVLADLHVGSPFNGIDKLRRIVDRTNAEQPDLICILGDMVVQGVLGGTFVTPEAIGVELKRLRAGAGVFAVLGNHDAWLDHARVKTALESNGVRVLEERALSVETASGRVWIAGVSDVMTGTPDVGAALASTDDSAPVILMTHNPDVFPSVPSRVALTIAGHTHGGQVKLPLLGTPIVPSRFGSRFAAGHIVEDGRQLYVATGLGTSILPVRFRVPPEITVLTLVSE
jgi:uncharacterized protein